MRIDIVTLFPDMFTGVFSSSLIGKARDKGLVELHTTDFREYANNKHRTVDDYPYGGGAGMVLQPGPIFAAVEAIIADCENQANDESMVEAELSLDSLGRQSMNRESTNKQSINNELGEVQQYEDGHVRRQPRIIMLCPQGEVFTQRKAVELAAEEHLILLCGHYEGFDERIREHLVTDELSVGDYVLTGGEIPAMIIMDSVVRLLPGVLGNEQSAMTDSFSNDSHMPLLEHPHYTRPDVFRGWRVPDVLLSGHHANIEKWRHQQSLIRTWKRRPELIDQSKLTAEERAWLSESDE